MEMEDRWGWLAIRTAAMLIRLLGAWICAILALAGICMTVGAWYDPEPAGYRRGVILVIWPITGTIALAGLGLFGYVAAKAIECCYKPRTDSWRDFIIP